MASSLNLSLTLKLLDQITAPVRGVAKVLEQLSEKQRESKKLLNQLGKQQEAINNFKQLKGATEQAAAAMAAQQQKVKALAQQMQAAGTPSKALTNEFNAATREAGKLKQAFQSKQQQLQGVRNSLAQAGIGTKNLSGAETSLRSKIADTTRALEEQQKAYSRLAEIKKKQDALNARHGKEMHRVAMMGATGAAGMAVGQKVYSSASRMLAPGVAFGEQMSELRAVSRMDADDERFLKLQQQARDLGASTAFTAADAAAGQTFLARANFSPEAIHASMQDMLNLALANKMDLARTADIASNISSAFKIDPEVEGNMQRVGDVLSGVAARSNVNLEMLGETMKYLGGAEDLNISLEQAATMAGLMGNIGIQGSQAGTAMRAMMNRLTAPAKSGIKAMEAIGLSVKDAKGQMRDMPDILMDIAKATQNMGNVQRKQIMKDIFGTEAGSGMTEIVSAMADGQLMELLTDLQTGVEGENAKMASVMADNIGGDLKGLVSAWEEVGIAMTTANGGPIRELIQSITGAVRWIGEWVKENPKLAATLGKIVGIVAVVATVVGALAVTAATVLGPLSLVRFAFGQLMLNGPMLIGAFKGIGSAFMLLGKAMLANPIFLAIAALAAAAYLIYRNWDDMVGGFKALLEAFGTWWADKTAILAQDWDYLTGLISAGWDSLWGGITGMLGGIWGTITEAFNSGIGGITALLLDWSPLGIFWQIMQPVFDWFGLDLPAKFSEFGANIIGGLVDGIKNMAGAAKDAVMNVGDNVSGWFKEKLGIHSPSRVFAELGGHTIDGLAVGMQAQEDGPLKRIGELGKKLTAAAGISLAATAALANPVTPELPKTPDFMAAGQPDLPDLQQKIMLVQQMQELTQLPDLAQRITPELPKTPDFMAAWQPSLPGLQQKIVLVQQAQGLVQPPDLAQRITPELLKTPDFMATRQLNLQDQRPIRFDQRLPLRTAPQRASAPSAPANITINIHAAPGMDERALAALVRQELEKAQRQQQVRQRSHFGDLE